MSGGHIFSVDSYKTLTQVQCLFNQKFMFYCRNTIKVSLTLCSYVDSSEVIRQNINHLIHGWPLY